MVQLIRTYPTPAALQALGLPTGPGSEPDVSVRRRNMVESLFKAVAGGRFNRVRFLLDNGAPANVTNDRGHNLLVTSLHIEDNETRDRMFQYLLKRRVDGCHVDGSTGRDVLMWACLLGRHVQVSHLMEDSVGELDFTRTDKQGMTALHLATIQGHIEVVRLLVAAMNKYRLAVDVTDKQGLTPFIYAKRLGHFAIADVLLREGHCSPRQFDNIVHRSVEDWTQIGLRERREFTKQQYRDMLAQHKIRGQMPGRMTERDLKRRPLPAITLSDADNDSARSLTLVEQDCTAKSFESQSHIRGNVSGTAVYHEHDIAEPQQIRRSGMHSLSKEQPGAHDGSGADARRDTIKLPRIAKVRLTSPGAVLKAAHNKSTDTAFALLDVQANHGSEIVHADQFVQSQLDTSKVNKFTGMMGNLTSMMDILSQQQSGAFRVVAKPKTPIIILKRHVPRRKKVSTLAVLFGKNNSSKRYRAASRGCKQKSNTLGQHGMTKKQKTSGRNRVK